MSGDIKIQALGKSFTPLPAFDQTAVVHQGKTYEILTWKKTYTKFERVILALKVIMATIFTLGFALYLCPSLKRDWQKATKGNIDKSVSREKMSASPYTFVRNQRPLEYNEGIVLAGNFLRTYNIDQQQKIAYLNDIDSYFKNPLFQAYPEQIMDVWEKKYGGITPHPGPLTSEGIAWRFFKSHYFAPNT